MRQMLTATIPASNDYRSSKLEPHQNLWTSSPDRLLVQTTVKFEQRLRQIPVRMMVVERCDQRFTYAAVIHLNSSWENGVAG